MNTTINAENAEKIKNGDETEFKKVYMCFVDKLYGFILSYVKQADVAEELVQRVFIKLWEKHPQIDTSKNLSAYLYKIATNLTYDHLRQNQLHTQTVTEHKLEHDSELSHNEVIENIYFNELEKRIAEILELLPGQRKKIFKMSRIEGLSYDEISLRLSISKRTVENQIYRAMQFIKHELQADQSWSDLPAFLLIIGGLAIY